MGLRAIMVAVDYTDILSITLPYNQHHFDEITIVTDPKSGKPVFDVVYHHTADRKIRILETELFYTNNPNGFNKWSALEWGLDQMGRHGWMCLTPDTHVQASGIKAASKRYYNGPIVKLRTKSGLSISLTPNHHLLTNKGWQRAEIINVGDKLFKIEHADTVGAPKVDNPPPVIGQVIDSLLQRATSVKLPMYEHRTMDVGMNFNSYILDSYVNVVSADSDLCSYLEPRCKKVSDLNLVLTDTHLCSLLSPRYLSQVSIRSSFASQRALNGIYSLSHSLSRVTCSPKDSCLRLTPDVDPSSTENSLYYPIPSHQVSSNLSDTVSALISPDDIISIQVVPWSGHVYDLSTEKGWYVANGIISHNCIMDADVLWPKSVHVSECNDGLFLGRSVGESLTGITIQPGHICTPLRRMFTDLSQPLPPEDQWARYPLHRNVQEWAGYSQVFNADDPVLGTPPWHEINWRHSGGADSFFQMKWPRERKVRPPFEVLHLGPAGENWYGRVTPYLDGTVDEKANERREMVKQIWAGRRERRVRHGPNSDMYRDEKLG